MTIATVRTPFTETSQIPKGPDAQHDAEGVIEVDQAFEAGLQDIEGFSHLYVLWHFHRTEGYDLVAHPPSDDRPHGVFATRSPRRPSPIGLTVVRLLRREGTRPATPEQYALFARYLSARHADGEMAGMTYADYVAMVEDSPLNTLIAEYRDRAGKLIGACLVDRLHDGLSAVYSFFEPSQSERSLGTYMIQRLIERTRAAGLPYLYLGYWISGSRKMAYKANFRPLEGLTSRGWTVLP